MSEEGLREKLEVVCTARRFLMGEAWVQKVLQLKQVGKRSMEREAECRTEAQAYSLAKARHCMPRDSGRATPTPLNPDNDRNIIP